jgi:mannose/fructose/N-acetylgalactosamine-specific phosphotransferase system component IIC
MTMMIKAFVSSLLAGLLELDNVQAGQFLLARPVFAGLLLGWFNSCPLEGARIGVLTELIYIDFIPVGAVVPPNGLVTAAAGVLAFSWAGLPESAAFFFGILAGFLYRGVDYRLRASRSSLSAVVEEEVAKRGVVRLESRLAGSLLTESAVSGLFIFLLSASAVLSAGLWRRLDPGVLPAALNFAYSLMPWLGLSGLYFRFRTQVYKKE